ncbi:MAG: DUF420 domain-containing protein [Bacteriovoracaceae bacterium]
MNLQNNHSSDKSALTIIGVLSVIICIFLFWIIYINQGAAVRASWVAYLPEVNASLNFITTCLLIVGYIFIKNGKREAHIKAMLSATLTSALFLVSYLVYHYYQGDTKFLTEGLIRYVYFFILITHILLSMIMVPMVFSTLYFAAVKKWEKHKKIARWTFPVWVYVSFTGVMIYFFLKFLNLET